MFRRIVSNLSFSPALVGQLGFYAKRLRKEETTRRIGLVFTALALVVQSLAVFSPPEAANAASAADFISGGVKNKQEFLGHYDNNTNRIKGLFESLGITRAEVAAAQRGSLTKGEVAGKYNWARTSLYSPAQGEHRYVFNNGAGNVDFFYRPLSLTANNPPYDVLVGKSAKFGWFAIKMDCGNLVTKTPPKPVERFVKCESLKSVAIPNKQYRVTITASKKNADITGYILNFEGKEQRRVNTSATSADFIVKENDAGTYTLRGKVLSNVGNDTGSDCVDTIRVKETPKPAAACTNVKAVVANRTIVSLSGTASVSSGASIQGYTFTVKNSSGLAIKTIKVSSSASSITADSFELTAPGTYTVTLTAHTSLGNQTSTACQASFTIAKKDVCPYSPSLPPSSPDCQPCPGDESIWIKDERCKADIIMHKTSTNMTQGSVDASSVIAKSSDKISYTLTVENKGIAPQTVTMNENLVDVVEYARLVDQGGGTYDAATKTLSWPDVSLAAGQKQSRTIALQIMDKVPSTNTGTSNGDSYDCKMINTYGNSVSVNVECSPEKIIVEQVVSELPKTGPRENMIFAAVLLAVVTYFYARSRQLGREVRLIRRNLNTGTI